MASDRVVTVHPNSNNNERSTHSGSNRFSFSLDRFQTTHQKVSIGHTLLFVYAVPVVITYLWFLRNTLNRDTRCGDMADCNCTYLQFVVSLLDGTLWNTPAIVVSCMLILSGIHQKQTALAHPQSPQVNAQMEQGRSAYPHPAPANSRVFLPTSMVPLPNSKQPLRVFYTQAHTNAHEHAVLSRIQTSISFDDIDGKKLAKFVAFCLFLHNSLGNVIIFIPGTTLIRG